MSTRDTKSVLLTYSEGGEERELGRDAAGQFYVRTVVRGGKKVRCPRWRAVDPETARELVGRYGGKGEGLP
ncbi:MAG: hypothetical protein H5T97_12365 [Firmicutes bacterium]|nr:hypothetical protein [Bacillota bacterium]